MLLFLSPIILYAVIGFVVGFSLAWFIRTVFIFQLKKSKRSTDGFLESERLMKETLKNENAVAQKQKQTVEIELTKKITDLQKIVRQMDADILLMQKSNEETEALLAAGQPEIHQLKMRLIEAQNTIARYKAQLGRDV